MSFLDKFKRNTVDLGPMTTNIAEEEADRDTPSVNAKGKGSKAMGLLGLLFLGGLGMYMMYQLNTGASAKERAEAKRVKDEAQANAVTGALPPLTAPKVAAPPPPPEVKVAEASQPHAVPAIKDVASAPVAGEPVKPIPVRSAGGAGGTTGGKPVQTPYEAALERKARGGLQMKFAAEKSDKDLALEPSNAEQREIARRMAGYGLTPDGKPLGGSGSGSAGNSGAARAPASDDFSRSLNPAVAEAVSASVLPDRNFLIAKGTFLDCALETRLDSSVPGMTSCILTTPVYSDNGKLVLLEAGSKIVGQYQGGLKQGQARIFVVWTRVQTPTGVVVNINSPGTDALGASGLDGYVDTHFWQRFGGAIMLSMIGDVGDYIAASAQRGSADTAQFNFGNTQAAAENMATEALKSSINIPPTLRKNHGDHINIYVAQDLSMEKAYAIRAR